MSSSSCDEWVFSVRVAASVPLLQEEETTTTTNTNTATTATTATTQKSRVLQLKHTTTTTRRSSNANNYRHPHEQQQQRARTRTASFENIANPRPEIAEPSSSVSPAEERVALLSASSSRDEEAIRRDGDTDRTKSRPKGSDGDAAVSTFTSSCLGWTFTSPYWSLQSTILLTITYCPAWQMLPEYTRRRHCFRCSGASWCCTTGSTSSTSDHHTDPCCSSCGCGATRGGRDFVQQTFTTRDVVSVRRLNHVDIPGVSSGCQGIQLQLRPLCVEDVPLDVPSHLQDSWQRHVDQIMVNRQELQASSTMAMAMASNNRRSHRRTAGKEEEVETIILQPPQQQYQQENVGPTVTFCLAPSDQDHPPPLLWKVDLPALSSQAISVETITVLDGKLVTTTAASTTEAGKQQQPQPLEPEPGTSSTTTAATTHDPNKTPINPTHIYIHGFQSWSFTGSIVKGKKTPTSALPDVFSRAFNLGGSPPPAADPIVVVNDDVDDDNDCTTDTSNQPPWFYKSDFFTCITSDAPAAAAASSLPAALLHPHQRLQQQLQQARNNSNEPPYQQLDETGGPAMLLGWLSQHEQFGIITSDQDLERFWMHASADGQVLLPTAITNAWSSSTTTTTTTSSTALHPADSSSRIGSNSTGSGITTDWAYCQLVAPHSYDEEPAVHYMHAAAAYNMARPLQNGSLLVGWCSWYVFYENITAALLKDNFEKLATEVRCQVPTNVSVVDDGYMTAWGDWGDLKRKAFPGDGLHQVSRDISNTAMRPGLWLAPFAADKHSQLAKDHPDWIIRNFAGAAANSSNCGKWFYGLDATHPGVRRHVDQAIRRAVQDWDYSVLKIDFLYAACLQGNGKFDLSQSRAQAMYLALQTIREAAGSNVFLIGCGCPIASGIGFVDAMRVSADTGPNWYPTLPLPYWDNGTLPSLRTMVRNSIARAPMGHRWWHNDPDCLMLGEHTRLTDEEVASAASVVAMTCGMLLLSDDLPKVNPKRMQIVSKIFPLTGVPAVVLDLHSTNDGLPCLMRLWCTDKYDLLDSFRDSSTSIRTTPSSEEGKSGERIDHNAEATYFARQVSFNPDAEETPHPNERMRSCIHVTKGLGTWTVVSISNWLDKPAIVHVPPMALLPPPEGGGNANEPDSFLRPASSSDEGHHQHGYHAFGFWSGKYSYLPPLGGTTTHTATTTTSGSSPDDDDNQEDEKSNNTPLAAAAEPETISRKLAAHETEIYHIKPVTPEEPQYVGSDLHFSCGKEVRMFRVFQNSVSIFLDTTYRRTGHVFVYVPRADTSNVKVSVNKETARWEAIGNTPRFGDNGSPRLAGRVIRIQVVVHGDDRPFDGKIHLEF